jgi:phospholipid/cholesterol/gamma-HCH transport system permease protein
VSPSGAEVSSRLTSEDIVNDYTTPFEEAISSVKSLTGGGRRAVESLGALYAMVLDTMAASIRELAHGRFAWREFVDQSWFLASVSVLPAILIAIPFGLVIVLEVGGLAGQIGAASFVGAVDAIGTVREASPIVTALLLAGAGGSAICSELGARTIRDEISAMEVMGINPLERLVAPRMLATVVVAVLLNGIVSFSAIASGYFADLTVLHGSAGGFLNSFATFAQPADLIESTLKAAIFGLIAAVVASYKGMTAKRGPAGVGEAVTQSVVITGIALFFVDIVLTEVFLVLVPPRIP